MLYVCSVNFDMHCIIKCFPSHVHTSSFFHALIASVIFTHPFSTNWLRIFKLLKHIHTQDQILQPYLLILPLILILCHRTPCHSFHETHSFNSHIAPSFKSDYRKLIVKVASPYLSHQVVDSLHDSCLKLNYLITEN